MILTIDIGNTTVSLGGVEKTMQGGYFVRFMERLDTNCSWGVSEYTAGIRSVLDRQRVTADEFEGAVLSSVVPHVEETLRESARRILGKQPMRITAESNMGLAIDLPEPEKVGQDRLVDSAWVAAHFALPAVTADLGTATTLNVIRRRRILRRRDCRGVDTGLQALAERRPSLPQSALCVPERIIGRNTAESMLSGAVAGTAAMLDGIVREIEQELGKPVTLVITGGMAKYVEPLVRHPHTYDPELLLKGLALLYEKNQI